MTSMASEAISSSSSVSNNSFTYQVFLSFRGETRNNFTGYLYYFLREKGINTFIDDKLPKGEKISEELVKTIKESEVSIIVFSENYAGSRWCLDELVQILECKASNQQQVRTIFYKVDPSDVRHQKGKFGDAFKKLDGRYNDCMDGWRAALTDAADLSGRHFKDDKPEYQFITEFLEELSNNVLNRFNNLKVAKCPIGIDSRRQDVEKLLDMENDVVCMIGIWGVGGIGKSTIAKAVFNSINGNFKASCFLADVRSNSIPQGGLPKLQRTLLSNILRDSNLTVDSVDNGVALIEKKLQRKRVLLVLDDVSDKKQLENLAPSTDCFGPGSRIIITTRDQHLLTEHEVNPIYKVRMLDDVQASELFSWHAFKCNQPPWEYRRLTERAVHYAGGLPLALKVLGSHMFGRSKEVWESILDGCRGDHRSQIINVLRISYDALGDDLKEIFLDIACFFKGEDVTKVEEILEACHKHFQPKHSLQLLQEKSLIRIDTVDDMFVMRDVIWMHDLIEEMGKDIGKHSRLWNWDDIDSALRDNTGTKEFRGIHNPDFNRKAFSLNAKSFSKMKNLTYMSVGNSSFLPYVDDPVYVDIDFLSNKLKWLHWPRCPLRSFPTNFYPKELVRLSITHSRIKRLWEGWKILPFLKSIYLVYCPHLTELPDFAGTPNLESLILVDCPSLVKMHHSVGALHKLVTLEVRGCYRLTALPKLNGNVYSLRELTLRNFRKVRIMPCSIYGFQHLQSLSLKGFPRLAAFPTNPKNLLDDNGGGRLSLPRLKKLEVIDCNLSNCDFLQTLDCLDTLTYLDLSDNKFVSLPECISNFHKLEVLNLCMCRGLEEVADLPPSLMKLDMQGCISLGRLWNLSDVLEGKERQQRIKWMNLWNMDEANSPFFVVFPGTITAEDAKLFDCWTSDIIDQDVPKCSITICKNLKWENLALAVCAVSRGDTSVDCTKTIYINGVGISLDPWTNFISPSFVVEGSMLVWVDYIPLPVEMKAEVDDQKGYSALPHYQCVVEFEDSSLFSQPFEGFGVHLVCLQSKDDGSSSQKVVKELVQQRMLHGEDDDQQIHFSAEIDHLIKQAIEEERRELKETGSSSVSGRTRDANDSLQSVNPPQQKRHHRCVIQ